MIDTYNQATGGQAVFKQHSIYNEFHRDRSWIQYLLLSIIFAAVLITVLYFWNRTLKNRLDHAVKGLEKAVFFVCRHLRAASSV